MKNMQKTTDYYVVKQKAVPEVLLKVVEAKRLLDSGKAATIQDAVEKVDISRSSFYKYKDDIFPFHDNAQGTTITLAMSIEDEPGLLSDVRKIIADFGANILTDVYKRQIRGYFPSQHVMGRSQLFHPAIFPDQAMAVAGSHIKMIGILIHLFHNRMQENTAVLRTDFSGAVIKDPPFRERDSFLFRKSNDITAVSYTHLDVYKRQYSFK